jgi:hypothetical protein
VDRLELPPQAIDLAVRAWNRPTGGALVRERIGRMLAAALPLAVATELRRLAADWESTGSEKANLSDVTHSLRERAVELEKGVS